MKRLATSLYRRLVGTFFLLLFHTRLPAALRSRDSRARCLGLSPGTARLLHSALSSLPFPANAEPPQGEEAGGRWLEAQRHCEERARVSSTAKYPDSPQTGQILYSSQPYRAFMRGKSKVACQAGCQPVGERISGSCWLVRWTMAHFCCTKGAGLCRGETVGGGGKPLLQAQ